MAAYFSDDRMYHERLLLWKRDAPKWVIMTPLITCMLRTFLNMATQVVILSRYEKPLSF